uniref:Uncharacterized protein n=1 Tax=Arundo donax TaxID=35708 RepID=A0A0A9BKU3_ARUDO
MIDRKSVLPSLVTIPFLIRIA